MNKRVVILGGGVGGLSAGWMLSRTGNYSVNIIEKDKSIGGICGTFRYKDLKLDYGAHKVYSVQPGILDELRNLMGNEFIRHRKKNNIYMFNNYLEYPFKFSDLIAKMGFNNVLQCSAGMAGALFKKSTEIKTGSYKEYVINKFGKKFYELVFESLADKIWGDPASLSADIAKTRIPSKSIFDTFLRTIGARKERETTDAKYFYYPKDGFGRIAERMKEEIMKNGGSILTESCPLEIKFKGNRIDQIAVDQKGQKKILSCDLLISAIPLKQTMSLVRKGYTGDLDLGISSTEDLQYRTAILVYLVLQKERISDYHWTFFPDRNVVFSRVFEQKSVSDRMVPENKTVLCCDFTVNNKTEIESREDEIIDKCIGGLERVGLIDRSWVLDSFIRVLPDFYPRYDVGYKTKLENIVLSLSAIDNLVLTGRLGFYNYNNLDHCIDMGKYIADCLTENMPTKVIIGNLKERVAGYKIID